MNPDPRTEPSRTGSKCGQVCVLGVKRAALTLLNIPASAESLAAKLLGNEVLNCSIGLLIMPELPGRSFFCLAIYRFLISRGVLQRLSVQRRSYVR